MTTFLLSLILVLNSPAITRIHTPQTETASIDQDIIQLQLNPKSLQKSILEYALIYYTNKVRQKHRLLPCQYNEKLQDVARLHSHEMDSLNYFSHFSPVPENHELLQRFKNANIKLVNMQIGENIGVDYYLAIASIPFYIKNKGKRKIYINIRTNTEIPYQTYGEFARDMVEKWMASPGHRKNILTPEYTEIGIGVASGIFEEMDAIYVTQLFMGPISIQN